MRDMEEMVFAFPTNELWKLLKYKEKGFIEGDEKVLNRIVQNGIFRERQKLEEDPSFKQIIPYAIISNKDSYLLLKRTTGQTEKRLHNKLSLGFGGHMNPGKSKISGEQYIIEELKREFFEEVRLINGCQIEDISFIGFINDDTIPVGRYHIGLLYDIRVSNKEVYIRETNKMSAEWVDKSKLKEYYEGLESWSKIAMDSHTL